MSAKPILVSALVTLAIVGAFGLYFVVQTDLQNLEAQQLRLLPDPAVFDDRVVPLEVFEGTQQLRKLSSEDDIRDFLLEAESMVSYLDYADFPVPTVWNSAGSMLLARSAGDFDHQAQSAGLSARMVGEGSHSLSSTSFSEQGRGPGYVSTNIQVAGVDEPDHIKTDGKHVYVLSGRELVIIDAYPPEDAKIISNTDLDIRPHELHDMFLNDDRAVIFYTAPDHEKRDAGPGGAARAGPAVTHAMIVDVSDRASPKIIKDYGVDGQFRDARMVGDHVYLVSSLRADYSDLVVPRVTADGLPDAVLEPGVFYFDNYEPEYAFNTVTAIRVSDESFVNAKTFLIGPTNTVYASHDGLYIAYKKSLSTAHRDAIKKDRFFEVIVPMLPPSVQDRIGEIRGDPLADPSKKHALATALLEDTYNSVGYVDKKTLFSNIGEQLAIYDSRVKQESENTVIHKIGIEGGAMEHKAQGGVPGWLLNQFSMDEYGGSFRAVTTYESYDGGGNGGTTRYNAVYVMDSQHLGMTGILEGIAPNEDVFAARFMGDRLYLVTFERVDPFFVIDLSPDSPKVLGELKIPGFSNYLHPYGGDGGGESHIVGIGRNADMFGAQLPGVKLALFDVSDVKNPSVVDDVIIGVSGQAGSEALGDHKAFFLDASRGVLSIPIHDRTDSRSEFYDSVGDWHGFYVYGLDAGSGFDLQGTIKHSQSSNMQQSGYRSFYIGDALYTASPGGIKINEIDNIKNELGSIRFDYPSG